MRNIEKYEEELRKYGMYFAIDKQNVICDCDYISCNRCIFRISNDCSKNRMDWLLSEYKEPILDDVEKEYLNGFIKPSFRKAIEYITKWASEDGFEWLVFGLNYKGSWGSVLTHLPPFEEGTMYKGMKVNKKYSLKDLGL